MREKLRKLLLECTGQMMEMKMSADLILIALDLTIAQITVERKLLFLEKMKQILLTKPTEEKFHTEISKLYKEFKQIY